MKRLEAIINMVPPCDCAADIGTDHAYVPVALVQQGICSRAIAADVREGPLAHARETIAAAGLTDVIDVRLSDGFANIATGEAESAILTGMGGRTILAILKAGNVREKGIRTLILSPQSEAEEVREYLFENDFTIADECLVDEDGKYYPVLRVLCSPGEGAQDMPDGLSKDIVYRYGPVLIKRKDAVLLRFLQHETEVYQSILSRLTESTDVKRKEKIKKLLKEAEVLADYMDSKAG